MSSGKGELLPCSYGVIDFLEGEDMGHPTWEGICYPAWDDIG